MKNRPRKLKCLLVEDEARDIERYSQYIKNHERLEYIDSTIDLVEFSKIIGSQKIDILFLDNELGKGIETLRNQGHAFLGMLYSFKQLIPILPNVICISQYPGDIQNGHDLDVWDVIAKPFTEETFQKRVKSLIESIDMKESLAMLLNDNNTSGKKPLAPIGKIIIKSKGTNQIKQSVDLSNIIYIQSVGEHDINVHLDDGKNKIIETTNTNFATIADFLLGKIKFNPIMKKENLRFFSKIERGCIINICYITEWEANDKVTLKNVTKPLKFGNGDLRRQTMDLWSKIYQSDK